MKVNEIQSLVLAAQEGDADAQFRLAGDYLARRQVQLANGWMSKAAAAGHEQAQLYCAGAVLSAPGKGERLKEICTYLVKVAGSGHPEANFMLANQLFHGEGILGDEERARVCFETAIRANLPAAWRVLAMFHVIQGNDEKIILSCFHKAAVLGDPYAQYAAAAEVIRNDERAKNSEQVAQWLENSARRGVFLARILLKESKLDDKNTKDFQVDRFITEISIADALLFDWPKPRHLSLDVLGDKPLLAEAPAALRKEECEYVMSFAHPALSVSRAIDPASGASIRDPVRTSSGMNFSLVFKDIVVGFVEQTMASAAGMQITNSEPLAVLNYQPGEEYKPHFDAFLPNDPGASQLLAMGGQRIKTVLVYLNDDFVGGATDFPNRSLRVEPEVGKLLVMENCEADGSPSQVGLHAGLAVTEGEKWLASMWLRERTFRETKDG